MEVYEMIMDSKKHQSLSGEKAKISRKIGGPFTAWGGHLTGINLCLKPGERNVQAWRATGWPPDYHSAAIFELSKVGTRMARKLDLHEDAVVRYCGSAVAIMGFEYAESARPIPIFADRCLRM